MVIDGIGHLVKPGRQNTLDRQVLCKKPDNLDRLADSLPSKPYTCILCGLKVKAKDGICVIIVLLATVVSMDILSV
jgi:hypothetical protein